MKRCALFLALPFLLLTACDGTLGTEPEAPLQAPESALHAEGAAVARGAYPWDFGPVPVDAPCLADHGVESAAIGGTWGVRVQRVITPAGRIFWNEFLDYSDVRVTAGDLTWEPGSGAHEKIQWMGDPAPRNVVHELHIRYISQDGLPDLRVTHRIHRVLGPDGTLRRSYGVPPTFSAECLGSG